MTFLKAGRVYVLGGSMDFVTAAEKYRISQHQMCNFDAMEFEAITKAYALHIVRLECSKTMTQADVFEPPNL